jgi:hypothetical protein
VADRLRVNRLVHNVASWVPSAMARHVELWDDNLVIPPTLAARAAVMAFGGELIDLELPKDADSRWLSQGGREMAAAVLLPRAEAALRQELLQSRCSSWPTPSRELAKASAHPRAARERYDGPRACWGSRSIVYQTCVSIMGWYTGLGGAAYRMCCFMFTPVYFWRNGQS